MGNVSLQKVHFWLTVLLSLRIASQSSYARWLENRRQKITYNADCREKQFLLHNSSLILSTTLSTTHVIHSRRL